jgi:hypothetical protein
MLTAGKQTKMLTIDVEPTEADVTIDGNVANLLQQGATNGKA